ncbi:nitrogen fixation protein nifU, putative [Entamoeba invadens IP1]|uniref:Nitrogen fixation protein nifU, putative n=1 Tax=Entamoeba invadens IP1 TaxID=370355 RepID=A0A0A1UD17_ENTIV|nr:nitrogen fixation protein nifU, putative [Entamoeba invadens IP1]ELP94327.1 nitrogen fixation protein nifU, putative [Entamoeba invadens IP1]|eukprot:XP_004261098.1 nitrogen fixation protein nifU, putative [Entamoeba invadens IP1]
MSQQDSQHYCKIQEHINSPKHYGVFTEEQALTQKLQLVIGDYHSILSGDAMRLYLLVDATGLVQDAKYEFFGNPIMSGLADVMTGLCIHKTIDRLLKIKNDDIEKEVTSEPKTPKDKMFRTMFFYKLIQQVVSVYTGKAMNDIESMDLVCTCGGISLARVKSAIKEKQLTSVDEIVLVTRAGTFCGSCLQAGGKHPKKYYLDDVLQEIQAEIALEKKVKNHEKVTLYQISKTIETFFQEHVMKNLKEKIEIIDIKKGTKGEMVVVITIEQSLTIQDTIKIKEDIQKMIRKEISTTIDVMVETM